MVGSASLMNHLAQATESFGCRWLWGHRRKRHLAHAANTVIPTQDRGRPERNDNKNVHMHHSCYYRLISCSGRKCYKGIIQISAQLYFVAMVRKIEIISAHILQNNSVSLWAVHTQIAPACSVWLLMCLELSTHESLCRIRDANHK